MKHMPADPYLCIFRTLGQTSERNTSHIHSQSVPTEGEKASRDHWRRPPPKVRDPSRKVLT